MANKPNNIRTEIPAAVVSKWAMPHKSFLLCLLFFAVGLIIRILFLQQISVLPYFDSPIIDAKQYDDFARLLVKGDLAPLKSFYQAPLYSYFIAAIYKVFGVERSIVHIIHILIGAVNILLIYFLAKKIFDSRIALVSSFITAFYGTFIFFEGDFFRENLLVSIFILLFLTTYWSMKTGAKSNSLAHASKWLITGIVFALTVLTRENSLVFLPLFLYIIWASKARIKKSILFTICFILPLSFFLYWMAKYNYEAEGKWSLTSSQGGLNFYTGNNPDLNNVILQPGIEWEKISSLPLQQADIYNSIEASNWYYKKAFGFIFTHPFEWTKMMLKKFYLFWAGYEIIPNEDINLYRQASPILKVLFWRWGTFNFPFSIICPFAFLGMLFIIKQKDKERTLFLYFILLYMFSIVIFHVRSRYRLPVVPIFIILASYGLINLFSLLRTSDKKPLIRSLSWLSGFFVFLNFPFYNLSYAEKYPSNYNIAKIYYDNKEYGKAEQQFVQALKDGINLPEVYNDIAILHLSLGKYQLAVEELKKSISLAPDFDKMRITLGKTYRRMGLTELARREFEQASILNKYNVETFIELGEIAEKSNADSAKQYYHNALKLGSLLETVDPEMLRRARNGLWKLGETNIDDSKIMSDKVKKANLKMWQGKSEDIIKKSDLSKKQGRIEASDAWNNLGTSYLRAGSLEEAEKCFLNSLNISYSQTPAHTNIAILYRKMGKLDKAITHYNEALKLTQDNYIVLNNLGAIYRDKKDYKKSLEYLNKALTLDPSNPTIQKNIRDVTTRMQNSKN